MEFNFNNEGMTPNQSEIEKWKAKAKFYEDTIICLIHIAKAIVYNPMKDCYNVFMSNDNPAYFTIKREDSILYDFTEKEMERRKINGK